jgi:hypothetical protein
MRRTVALMTVLGLFAAGLGCKHVAGKCDCTQHPSDAIMPGPSTPYPASLLTTSPGTMPATAPIPMTPMKAAPTPVPPPPPGR